jgi:hypothetical protein
MTIEEAKSLIRYTIDNNNHEWIETNLIDFVWDSANIFRVRDFDNQDVYVFGSSNVVHCLIKGHVGPAINQNANIELASEIRNSKRNRIKRQVGHNFWKTYHATENRSQ